MFFFHRIREKVKRPPSLGVQRTIFLWMPSLETNKCPTPSKRLSGSTISTLFWLYMIKSTLKIARYCSLVIQGFSNFFRVVSSDYGKPRLLNKTYPPCKFSDTLEFIVFFHWWIFVGQVLLQLNGFHSENFLGPGDFPEMICRSVDIFFIIHPTQPMADLNKLLGVTYGCFQK